VAMAPWTKTVSIDSLTLSAAIQFIRSELNAGITEAMITTSTFYEALPFQRVDGNIGEVGETYYQDCKNDVAEISNGAKKLGRAYMRDVAKTLSAYRSASIYGKNIGFKLLNMLLAQVEQPDFLMAHHSLIRDIYYLHRAHGTAWEERLELPSGRVVPVYKDVPIFRNDFLDIREIIIGRFDDGTKTRGVSGLIPDAGFIGAARFKSGWQLTFTGGLTVFADDAVASLTDVEPY